MNWKQFIVSPSPAAASDALQLAQLVSVAESHGFKKAVQRFLLICFLGLKTPIFWRFLLILILLETTRFLKLGLIGLVSLDFIGFWCIIRVINWLKKRQNKKPT